MKKILLGILAIFTIFTISVCVDYFNTQIYFPNLFTNYMNRYESIIVSSNGIIDKEKIEELDTEYDTLQKQISGPILPLLKNSYFLLEAKLNYEIINKLGIFNTPMTYRSYNYIEDGVEFTDNILWSEEIGITSNVEVINYFNEEYMEEDSRISICISYDDYDKLKTQELTLGMIAYSKDTNKVTYDVYQDDRKQQTNEFCFWFDSQLISEEEYEFFLRLYNANEGFDYFIPITNRNNYGIIGKDEFSIVHGNLLSILKHKQ